MLSKSIASLFLLPAVLRVALAQSSSSMSPCNNSPSLCDQAYSNVTYLGAHDSPFLRDESTDFSTSGNQFYNTTVQLAAGVRLVTAQVQRLNDDSGALHVCHSSCDLLDAGTLSSWLGEVRTWMEANPSNVVTVLLVNGAGADASELASEYDQAGITTELAYTPQGDSYKTQQWPTLQSLISDGTRMINFVDNIAGNSGNSSSYPYLLPEFNYIFENSYDNSAPTDFSCEADRPSSATGNTAQVVSNGMMPLMNHFLYEDQAFGIQSPNESYVDTTNAPSGGVGTLGEAATSCTQAYGQAPNFLLVDFFNVGPAIETVDRLNGVTNAVGRRDVSDAIQQEESGSSRSTVSVGLVACSMVLMAFLL